MSGAVLTCSQALVNSVCPDGAAVWVVQQGSFDLPPLSDLQAAFVASVETFFVPTMIICFAAWGVRMILGQVR